MDFTVSGSIRSATAVYPERSANTTVALRRSSGRPAPAPGGARSGRTGVAGAPLLAGGTAVVVPVPSRPVPHSMQNFAPGGFSVPQLGHEAESPAPQDMQKWARSGLRVPQATQATSPATGQR